MADNPSRLTAEHEVDLEAMTIAFDPEIHGLGGYQKLRSDGLQSLGTNAGYMAKKSLGIHAMWRLFSSADGNDVQSQGLKDALVAYGNQWGIGATLVMTVCFAFLLFQPNIDDSIPLSWLTWQIFLAYNILAVLMSVMAINEIASAQEDIALVPAALIPEYLQACSKAGGHLGPSAIYGPDKWAHYTMNVLRTAGIFLIYTLHGRVVGAYAVLAFLAMQSCAGGNMTVRAAMWRNLEGAVWKNPERQKTHPTEFAAWQQGNLFFWCGWMGGWLDSDRAPPSVWSGPSFRFLVGRLEDLLCLHEIRWLAMLSFARIMHEVDVREVHELRGGKAVM